MVASPEDSAIRVTLQASVARIERSEIRGARSPGRTPSRISRYLIRAPLLTAPRILYPAQRGYSQRRDDDLPSVLNLQRQAGRLAAGNLAGIDALLTIAAAPPR